MFCANENPEEASHRESPAPTANNRSLNGLAARNQCSVQSVRVSLCFSMRHDSALYNSVLVALLRAIFQCHIPSKWTFGAVTCQETTGNLQSKIPVPSIARVSENGVFCA